MAEIIGIIGTAITVANSAATLSCALFDFVETIKNARKEIAYIAQQLSLLSGSLLLLTEVVESQQSLCSPKLFQNTAAVLKQYGQVEIEIRKLLERPRTLTWFVKKVKVKPLLQEIEAIKTLLSLQLSIIQLARTEVSQP